MLKWIKVRQESTKVLAGSKKLENDADPEIEASCKAEEEEDSGMEREDSPAIDLRGLKKVWSLITITTK